MAAGDLIDIVKRADDLLHRREHDHLVGIAAGDDCIRKRVGIRKGLGLTVLPGILVGDDGGFYAHLLDLLRVHDEVGIRVAEAFLRNDYAVKVQQAAELRTPVGGTLLVRKIHVLIGDDVADVVERFAVLLEEIRHHGVVLVVIGRVLRNPGGENVVENDNSNNY